MPHTQARANTKSASAVPARALRRSPPGRCGGPRQGAVAVPARALRRCQPGPRGVAPGMHLRAQGVNENTAPMFAVPPPALVAR